MVKKTFRFLGHSGLLALEIAAVTAGLVLLAVGLLVWRLSTGPLDVGFAKPYVEEALYDEQTGNSVTIGEAFLKWPDFKGPLVFELRRVDVIQKDVPLLQIAAVDLGVSRGALLLGQIEPVSIMITAPALRLIRNEQGDIHFLMSDAGSEEKHEEPDHKNPLEQVFLAMADPETARKVDMGPLASLDTLEIRDARMVVEDHVLGISWYLAPLDLAFARDSEGLAITSSLSLAGGAALAESKIAIDAMYNWTKNDLVIDATLSNFDPRILSHKIEELSFLNDQSLIVNANLSILSDAQLNVRKVGMNVSSENGALSLEGLYDAPLPFQQFLLKASYDREQKLVDLESLDVALEGVSVNAGAKLTLADDELKGPVTVTIPSVAVDTLAGLWPPGLKEKNLGAEKWITKRLSGGTFVDSVMRFDLIGRKDTDSEDQQWALEAVNVTADSLVENMNVDYAAPLMPVIGAFGKGRYENDTLTIEVQKGTIDDLVIEKADILITNVVKPVVGQATINAKLNGPLRSIFRYIEKEPIAFKAEEKNIKTKDVGGNAALDVTITFPTLRDLPKEQVIVTAKGRATDILLPGLVKGLDVTGGPMDVVVEKGEVRVRGTGKLQGREAKNTEMLAYFDSTGKPFSMQVKTSLNVDLELRKNFGAGLEDWIEGTVPANVVYSEFRDGRAEIAVEADATPIKLMVKPLEYVKPEGVAGTASARALLAKGFLKEVTDLKIETGDLKTEKAQLYFDTVNGESVLRRGQFPRAILGETDMSLDFEMTPARVMKLSANGSFLDAQAFVRQSGEEKKAPYTGPAIMASVKAERMRVHPTRVIDKAKVYLDMNNLGDINQFEMDAVAGKGALYLRFKPGKDGKLSIRVEADDAGAALRAFNVYENMEGGKLFIYGESINDSTQRRVLRGSGEILDFKVVKAPVLAQLVGAMSITGIPELLGGQGLSFARLKGDFDWVVRRQGDIYYLREGRTSGASLGLTFEGKVDKAENLTEIGGTIVPVTLVNDFISNIPLIGDILTGGDNSALFAATYTIKGPSDRPTITVNPLAVLTPGFLRKIFFEGDIEHKAPPGAGQEGPPAPPKEQLQKQRAPVKSQAPKLPR